MGRAVRSWSVAVLLVAVGLVWSTPSAHAEVACNGFSSAGGRCVNTTVTVGGTSYNADW